MRAFKSKTGQIYVLKNRKWYVAVKATRAGKTYGWAYVEIAENKVPKDVWIKQFEK